MIVFLHFPSKFPARAQAVHMLTLGGGQFRQGEMSSFLHCHGTPNIIKQNKTIKNKKAVRIG